MKFTLPLAVLLSTASAAPHTNAVPHANHIFNTIADSMRQFGSSIHHNGMSFFVAQIPSNAEFYHGTSSPYRINGTEWLAFEPEHALIFARAGGPHVRPPRHETQKPMIEEHGYLHTYRTKHPLRLLYIDGESAAKSEKGTLDTTDRILLHDSPPYVHGEDEMPPNRGPMGEGLRAQGLCNLAKNEWKGKIDGFLRMEGGFEIILCDFEKDLDVVRITQTLEPNPQSGNPFMFGYARAVAARYDGVGVSRVHLDYEHFVTSYAYDGLVFFEGGLPRIDNSSKEIKHIRHDIQKMVLRDHHREVTDWRDIVDMVVTRYSDRIELLSDSSKFDTLGSFHEEADFAMRVFTDYGSRDAGLESGRCAYQYLPHLTGRKPLAYSAILNVTTTLCHALSKASRATSIEQGVDIMRQLKMWLDWTSWKKCRGCQADEICYVPIWPQGSKEDLDTPRCVDEEGYGERKGGYWGGPRGPRPGRNFWQGL